MCPLIQCYSYTLVLPYHRDIESTYLCFYKIFQNYGWRNFLVQQSENFCVLPSLGQIVEGYSLIVPKFHYTCIGSMPKKLIEELIFFKNDVKKLYLRIYSDVIFFEHGCICVDGL